MRWTAEQYIDMMTYNGHTRQMFCELFGLLIGLDEEWKNQGASKSELDLTDFGYDYVDVEHVGNTGAINTFAATTLEENDEFVISRDHLGRTVKLCKNAATIPLPLDFPVKDMESWLKIKPMFTFDESRIDRRHIGYCEEARLQGALISGSMPGGFDIVRELMGEEVGCLAYYEQPELIHNIMDTVSDTAYRVYETLSRDLTIDHLCVHEDMAGKSGPLVGPNIINEYIKPYYRRTWDMLHERGARLFSQDSDGNMNPVVDAFIDCGVNVFYPCEPAAGMDIVALRKKYGDKIAFKGGIDKHVLKKSKTDIKAELEYKLQPLMLTGGCVFALDHRIPNGVPLENYKFYVRMAREILGLEPYEDAEKVFRRMAF